MRWFRERGRRGAVIAWDEADDLRPAWIDSPQGDHHADAASYEEVTDLIGGGGGGGSQPAFVGAVLVMSATQDGYASSDVVAFDTPLFDSDGFFNAPGTKLVVPAGLEGWYRVGLIVNASAFDFGTQTGQTPRVATSAAVDDLLGLFVSDEPAGGAAVCSGVMGPFVAGDDLRAKMIWDGGGFARMFSSGAQLTCEYLGPDA